MVGLCCIVLCCVALRCRVLCCVVLSVVVVCGPPHGGACCAGVRRVVLFGVVCLGGVWPPVWWGVRWCVAYLMVGRAALVCGPPSSWGCVALCCVVSRCVAVCCVVWCCVLWWCVAPLMVGRALSACVGCLFVFVVLLLLGRVGRAGLRSVCGAPHLCPGRDGRAGLPCACGAAPRVVVSRLLSPCRSFALVPLFCFLVCARLLAGCWRVPSCAPPPPGLCMAGVVVAPLFFLSLRACWFPLLAACGRLLPLVTPPMPPGLVRVSLLTAFCCLFLRARTLCCLCSPPAVLAPCPLLQPSWFVLRGRCRSAACLLLPSAGFAGVRRRWLLPPLPAPHSPLCLLFSAPPSAVCLRLVLPPSPPPFVLVSVSRASSPLLLCISACCFWPSGVRCTLPCCACFVVLRVCCGAALCCFGLPCAAWCPWVLCGAAASGVAPCVLLCRAAVFSAVRLGLVSCCLPCCSHCALLCHRGLFFWVLCCAASPGAVLRCVASRCSLPCCVAGLCAVCLVPCCFFSLFWLLLRAVLCPRVLCALLHAVLCCAVLLCVVLRLRLWCLGALCCAVRVVFCCPVWVCFSVCCAVPLGAVLRRVASPCPMQCTAVVHCVVCLALCCFFPRFWVLLCAVSCPRVLCGAVGCRAVWCVAWLCCPVLCAPCCVCIAVVLWCVLFFVAVRCAGGALVGSCWVRYVLRAVSKTEKLCAVHFQKQKNCFPLVSCLVYPVPPACNDTTHRKNQPALFTEFLDLGWGAPQALFLRLLVAYSGFFRPCTCSKRGGRTQRGWGSSGRRRYTENNKRGARAGECKGVTCYKMFSSFMRYSRRRFL